MASSPTQCWSHFIGICGKTKVVLWKKKEFLKAQENPIRDYRNGRNRKDFE
jgi:hypothetical protein